MIRQSRNPTTELRELRELHASFVDTDALNLPRRYHMLGIAIDNYQDSKFDRLHYALDEVQSFGELLQRQYGFEQPHELFDSAASKAAIIKALDSFSPQGARPLDDDDALLIYFAGHGGKSDNGSNSYFATYEAQHNERATWYSHLEFIGELTAIQARYILLIANSCFSGGLLTKRSAPSGSTLSLASISGHRSREILTSGKDDQEVYDNSSFATALRQTLRNPNKSWVLSDELHISARAYVSANDGHWPSYGTIQHHGLHIHQDARFIFQRRSGASARPTEDYQPTATQTKPRPNPVPPQSEPQPRRYISKNPDLQSIVDNDVLIQAGSFLMGSPEDEQGRDDDEGPQRQVQVRSFYLGRYPVTRGEYARFAHAMGSSIDDEWRDPGFDFEPNDQHPVVNVNWEDARTYIAWLIRETGLPYRLPSEAEWEYACRAGTSTRFWWGDDPGYQLAHAYANFDKNFKGTSAVNHFKPNPWSLHDMSGNVWEWVQDCWNDSYSGAPSDGSAWLSGDCDRRVLRGGSWNSNPINLRSANRNRYSAGFRLINYGFRLARTLA